MLSVHGKPVLLNNIMSRAFKTGIYVNPYNGYCYYNTKKNRKRLVHRVVWEEHYGKIPKGMEIHHINGNKTDNRIDNLELIIHKEHCNNYHPEVIKNMQRLSRIQRTKRSLRKQNKVKQLFKEGMAVKDIIQSLNYGTTTIYRYLRA